MTGAPIFSKGIWILAVGKNLPDRNQISWGAERKIRRHRQQNPALGWRSLESDEVYMKKVPLSSASPFAVAPDAITTGK